LRFTSTYPTGKEGVAIFLESQYMRAYTVVCYTNSTLRFMALMHLSYY
jgi:hypothetical protein